MAEPEKERRKRRQRERRNGVADVEVSHGQRSHRVPSSWTAGVMVGEASASWLTEHSPVVAVHIAAKVQSGLEVLTIVVRTLVEVMIAVSPGWASWTLQAKRADARRAFLEHHNGPTALGQDVEDSAAHADGAERVVIL